MFREVENNKMFKEGEIVAVNIGFGLQHYGIATGCGTVISASKRTGCVVEEDENTFSSSKRIVTKGYPSNLPSHIVIAHARLSIGKKWNLIDYNCQHFATECHNQKHSPQLQEWVLALGIVGLVFVLGRGKIT